MASSGNKRTTMAKRNRENKLRERRLEKQARREARKLGLPPDGLGGAADAAPGDSGPQEPVQAAREAAAAPVDADSLQTGLS
jgi:hypothetical protein